MGARVIDGHVDLVYEIGRKEEDRSFSSLESGHVTREKLMKGCVKTIVVALFSPDEFNGREKASSYFSGLIRICDEKLEGLKKIRSPEELSDVMDSEEETGVLFLVENADALIEYDLDELEKRKIKVVGLTHVGENRLACGNNVFHPGGLTGRGRELVEMLDEKGFAIDVAHLSDPSFKELLDTFTGPIISSHTGFRFFCSLPRNLDMFHLKAIFERGGVVGITVNPEMLTGEREAHIEDVFRHVDWVAEKFGPEYVAIGSDFCGFSGVCRELEDISMLVNLEEIMDKHGYPGDAIGQIMWKNWYDFYVSLLS